MNKKKKFITIVLSITVLAFIFMGVSFATLTSNSKSGTVNNIVNSIISPVQKFFWGAGNWIGDLFVYREDMHTYREDNLALKEKVEELERKVRELSAYESENERLREVLELKSNSLDGKMVVCEVSAKDPGNWFYVFTIDKGTNYGIKKNDAVMTNAGLVGRVCEVGANWAKVKSIIDSDSSVGAVISRTEETAIIDGDLTLAEQGKCRLNYIKSDVSIVAGDTIETSGLGGVYPKGVLIGTVSEIKKDSSGYARYAIVDTAVDFENIREVIVIKSDK